MGDQFVDSVKSLTASARWENLYQLCTRVAEDPNLMGNEYDYLLSQFNIGEHTLGILMVLSNKINERLSGQDLESTYVEIEEFITNCNAEQVRLASEIFAELCHDYTESLIHSKQLFRGIVHLQTAITKVQANPLQLTSIHSDLCQLCLVAKCVKPAIQFLDVDFTDISKENKSFDVRYFLQYYYYGGMIYASLKQYERALYFFEVAITTPSNAISMIVVESYKKYILISLILHGKLKNLPKYTSQIITRMLKQMIPHYTELVSAYSTFSIHKINLVISEYREQFTSDTNMGLVKQCVASLYKKNIQRLTKTFLKLSLEDMANRIHLSSKEEAEQYILNMIEEGEIFAQINQKDGMVVFQDNPEKFNSPFTLRKLEEDMSLCIQLDEKVREMDEENMKNTKYIARLRADD